MRRWAALLFFAACAATHAQDGWAHLMFQFQSRIPGEPGYSIVLNKSGGAWFWTGPLDTHPSTVKDGEAKDLDLGSGVRAKMFAALPMAGKTCETRARNIAQTGRKRLVYETGTAGEVATSVRCDFNYSDDARLNDAAAAVMAVVATMQEGDKLRALLRFDRLGLDAEMTSFAAEVDAGRAVEVQNIGPVLQSIAADDRVIERVRRQAARLLQSAGSGPTPGSPAPAVPDATPALKLDRPR